MATITRLTGLSSVLLRAWERRYDLLRPERGSGGHRLYTEEDLAVLRRVQAMIEDGRSIGEIAALGREALLKTAEPEGASFQEEDDPDALETATGEVVRAAVALDADRLERTLDAAGARVSFATLIERVIEPAAREIGRLWKSGECSVASEHMASAIFVHRIRRLIESAEAAPGERTRFVVAACLPGEEHHLGLLIVSYFLNRRGIRVLYLGPALPLEDLAHAVSVLQPGAVLMSVTLKSAFRKHRNEIGELIDRINHHTLFYMGGAGVPEADENLESRGLRLAPRGVSGEEAARKVVAELGKKLPS